MGVWKGIAQLCESENAVDWRELLSLWTKCTLKLGDGLTSQNIPSTCLLDRRIYIARFTRNLQTSLTP